MNLQETIRRVLMEEINALGKIDTKDVAVINEYEFGTISI